MRPGEVFITPIVQELWIKTLAENNLGRIRLRGWPGAVPSPDAERGLEDR